MKQLSKFIWAAWATCSTIGITAQNITKTAHGLRVDASDAPTATEITFYTPSAVRVVKFPKELAQAPEHKSYSIIAEPEKKLQISISEDATHASATSDCIHVSIDRNDGSVRFSDRQGNALLAEGAECEITLLTEGVDKGSYAVKQNYRLDAQEAIFGLGQRRTTAMNQRNEHVDFWNNNTHIYIPYFTSAKGYGVYWDNAGRSRFDDDIKSGITTFSSSVAQSIDYYFMYKDGSQDGVIATIHELTGKATMFPLWAMGYWQCRERYKTSDELCEVLDEYRRREIPLDAIVQDWQYWGCDSNWNAMRFMNPQYINKLGEEKWMKYLPKDQANLYNRLRNSTDPNDRAALEKLLNPRIKSPEEMVKYVHEQNAHLMITIWPDFGPWTDTYKELKAINALYPFHTWPPKSGARVYDAFNPQARDIYWKYLSHLHDMGFDAWWTDSTEPDHFGETQADRDYRTADGSWNSVKNAFPLATNRGIYEHERAAKGNTKRAVHMTRSGTFGIQHYGTFSWSGDIQSNWEEMKNQIPSGLNYVICGIPFWNTDIGGFFGGDIKNDPKNPYAQELQVRWMQWGTFMPLMRNHCSSPMVSEIYAYGEPGDWAYDVQKKFIELRYRLLPYIYSQAGATVQQSDLMMRPLVMDFATDAIAINRNDEYLFGRALLVKPVTSPLYTYRDEHRDGHQIYPDMTQAAAPVEIYLPNAALQTAATATGKKESNSNDTQTLRPTQWYDFWTNRCFDGGRVISTLAPIDRMPVFVRAGSIIPFGPAVQYTTEKSWDNLEIRIYPGADGEFVLYEDENDNYNYEKGKFSQIRFLWNDESRCLTIADRTGKFPNMLKERDFRILLIDKNAPSGDVAPAEFNRTVHYNGKRIEIRL